MPDDGRLSAGQIGRDDERSALRFDVPDFLIPKSIADVREMARLITLAEWAPDSYRDLEGNYVQQKIELAIMQGATVGLGPITAVQSIAVIEGMPTIWGDGALAIVERSGLIEDMHEEYLDDDEGLTAICTMRRRRRPTPIVNRFSMAMAEQACLTRKEGPWQLYPQRMLRMRARSWTLRDGFADVLRGLHIREEVIDFAGGAALPVITPDRAAISRMHGRGCPRPRRQFVTARSAVAEPRTARLPEPGVVENPNAQTPRATEGDPEPLKVTERPRFTLIDADGVVIDIAGPEALRCGFERLLLDKCLSADQVRGLWEWNAAARTAIETQFGAAALSAAAGRVAEVEAESGSAEGEPPPPEAGAPETFAGAAACAATSAPLSAAQHPVSADPDLVLPIDPTWGDQKVFRHYRTTVAALRRRGMKGSDHVAAFRAANAAVETRLRTKLPEWMKQIDALYAELGARPAPC